MKRLDKNGIKERIYKLCGNEFTVLSEYKSCKEKMKFRHNKCGRILLIAPRHFLYDGIGCKYCANQKKSKSPEQFKKEFYNQANGDYELLEDYYRENIKVSVKHKTCGKTYKVSPKEFLRGRRCPYCFGNKLKTTEEFSKEVMEKTNNQYVLVSPYIDSKTNVIIKHKKCGKCYKATPHDFLSGNRCPYCKQSKGEKLVESVLTYLGVKFVRQKKLSNCIDTNTGYHLRYDFYLPNENILIEYDGIQHYKPVKYFGGSKKFIVQKRRDLIKTKCANEKNINLIRVPYYLSNTQVKDLLKKEILS